MDRSIGEMIREARNGRGISQTDLAELLIESHATASQRLVSYWENDRDVPDEQQMMALERVLDITLSDANLSQNLTWKEAIMRVLSDAGEAMPYSEIAEQIVDRNLRTSVGATPANSVYAIISKAMLDADSAFYKAGPGTFGLRVQQEPEAQWSSAEEEYPNDAEDIAEETHGTIIRALGMFWLRNDVNWKNNPAILGRQHGGDDVNLAGQRGVYLLHDRHDVIYVGKSVDRPLGQRLYEHTRDRHGGRWNRFSWFGLLGIDEDGQIDSEMPTASGDDIITTLESILIECLEPPQNRRRGDHLDAVEFIQSRDPEIDRKEKRLLIKDLIAQMEKLE